MALPQQLKAARMTDATAANTIDNQVGNIEKALADIFGFTLDTDITEAPILCDNSGRITKALIRHVAAAPVGLRFRDSTASKEFRLVNDQQGGVAAACIDENTGSEGTPTWTRRIAWRLSDGVQIAGPRLAYASVANSSLISNTLVSTAFDKTFTIPGGSLIAGSTIRISYSAEINNQNSGQECLFSLKPRIGGITGAGALYSIYNLYSGNILGQLGGDALFTVRTIGAAGVIAAGPLAVSGPPTASGQGNGGQTFVVDTTGDLVVDILLTMTVAHANTSALLSMLSVEILTAGSTS